MSRAQIALALTLTACGGTSMSTTSEAPQRDNDVQAYATTLNRIFTRNGRGITVGPEDGSLELEFGTFVIQPNGTATTTVKRTELFGGTARDKSFALILRENASGAVEFGMKKTGSPKETTYEMLRLGDARIVWANGIVTPYNNPTSGGKWQIAVMTFDVQLNEQGRTVYRMDGAEYQLTPAFLARTTEDTLPNGDRFLRDAATREQITYHSSQMADLVRRGVVFPPVKSVVTWKQLAP